MTRSAQSLQINIHKVDGSTATFTQSEADLVNRTLSEFHPARIFNQETIAIADSQFAGEFIPSLITRVDLVSDRLSVWDFPFVIGALLELTEAEFHEFFHERQRQFQIRPADDFPICLEIEMVNHHHAFLWTEVIAGFPFEQLLAACSRLKKRSLVFGLRNGGIGILNPANLLRFTVYPDPLNGPAETWHARQISGAKLARFAGDLHGLADDGQSSSRFPQDSQTNFSPTSMESK